MTREEFAFWLETNHEDALDRARETGTSLEGWIDRLATELKALAKRSSSRKKREEEVLFDDPDDGEDDDLDDDSEDEDE